MADQLVQVSACSLGSGVKSVQWGDAGTAVKTKADDNVYATGMKRVEGVVTVTVTFQDQEEAQGVTLGTAVSFTAAGMQVNGAGTATVTVVNFMPLSVDATLNDASEGTATVTGEAYSADGTTSPISIAVV